MESQAASVQLFYVTSEQRNSCARETFWQAISRLGQRSPPDTAGPFDAVESDYFPFESEGGLDYN